MPKKTVKKTQKKPLKKGRPTGYSQEIADKICELIAEGYSLRAICRADEMPALSSVFKWLNEYKEFSDQYARAREEQAEALVDEILEIADYALNDKYKDENGQIQVNHDVIARSRLRVDSRKWIASKLKPKKYGDATTLKGDKENPLTVPMLQIVMSDESNS